LSKHKSKLTQTSPKSDICERVQSSLAQTVPVGSSFALKDWLFVIALIVAVFLVYEPVWPVPIWCSPECSEWQGARHYCRCRCRL